MSVVHVGWLLNIDIALISIELLLITDVNRKICVIYNIMFINTNIIDSEYIN